MTMRAATELAPRLAAIAVSNALMPAHSECATPQQAVPVLFEYGTADKFMPYEGGSVSHSLMNKRGTAIGAEATIKIWRDLARLPEPPSVTTLAHRDQNDPTSVQRYVWGSDPARIQVQFLRVDKGGHVQPSMARRVGWPLKALLGAQNADLEFAEESWAFFRDKRTPR